MRSPTRTLLRVIKNELALLSTLQQLLRNTTYRDKRIMAHSRRDFLRTTACALGSFALASSIENFGVVHALTPQAASDYKALVMVFLNGGNDGNQMFLDLNQYNTYSTARNTAGLAIPQANYLPVSPVSGGSFGFHPNMTEIQGLFNQGRAAV